MNQLLKLLFNLKGEFSHGSLPVPKKFKNVEVTPFRGDAKAAVTISADFELEWAFRRVPEEMRRLEGVRTRQNMPSLLAVFEETGIPITWATVGHLFLEHCERAKCGLAHPNMPRPTMAYNWVGDWYRLDPCTDLKKHPGWYSPDLIWDIRESKMRHEIGSHSFSHIDFCPEYSTSDLVRRELEECQRLMEKEGLRMRSLVYPRNRMGHQHAELLASLGITAVRHQDPQVRLSYPKRNKCGVYWLYDSMSTRVARWYDYVEKARIFIEEAVKRNAAYHIWFHPSDPIDVFEKSFYPIVRLVAKLRDRGDVSVATMAELAAYCEAREQTTLDVQQGVGELRIALHSNYNVKRYGKTTLTLRVTSDSMPTECLLRTQERYEPVKWNSADLHGNRQEARSFLVDVPASASELRVLFKPKRDRKRKRTRALADPAFG